MSDDQLKAGAQRLSTLFRECARRLSAASATARMPRPSVTDLEDAAARLLHVAPCVDARTRALSLLQQPAAPPSASPTTGPDELRAMRADADVRRLLLVQGYLVTTWSVYDSATKAMSDVLPPYALGQHDGQGKLHKFPKVLGGLFGGEDSHLLDLKSAVSRRAGLAVAFSYAVRNRFAHDAGWVLATPVFEDHPDSSAPFRMTRAALGLFVDAVQSGDTASGASGKTNSGQAALAPAMPSWMSLRGELPWRHADTRDLLGLLLECHADIDRALCSWMTFAAYYTELVIGLR